MNDLDREKNGLDRNETEIKECYDRGTCRNADLCEHLIEVARRDGLQAITQYERAQKAEHELAAVTAELATVKAERDAMRTISTYARHLSDCDVFDGGDCTCGFSSARAALAALEAK